MSRSLSFQQKEKYNYAKKKNDFEMRYHPGKLKLLTYEND